MENKKGNILITFVLLVALAGILVSYLFLVSGKTRNVTFQQDHFRTFYLAEAGMQKAAWYLNTSPAQGGYGISWRTASLTESLGEGQYTIRVEDWGSNEILITSSGEVHGTTRLLQQRMKLGNLPAAFDYALFGGNGGFGMGGSVNISGDIFANGDISITGNSVVINGEVYHPAGTTVAGGGTYVDGGEPNPVPVMPTLDTSSYDSEISIGEGVSPGDLSYMESTTINLEGQTIYVNGNFRVAGNTVINGPGKIIATGNMDISGRCSSDGSDITFVSSGQTQITGNADLPNATFYARDSLRAAGSVAVEVGSFLTEGDLEMSGNLRFNGLVYCGGEADMDGNITLTGSLVASTVDALSGSMTVNRSEDLPDEVAGLVGDGLYFVAGSWNEP